MCSVQVVQVALDESAPYQYGREYIGAKTVLTRDGAPLSTTIAPGQTPWQAIQSLYTFPHLDNKENLPVPATARHVPPCVELVVIFEMRQEQPQLGICTVWKSSEGSFYDPTAQTQIHEEEIGRKLPWIVGTHAYFSAADTIEIRTIARRPTPLSKMSRMLHEL